MRVSPVIISISFALVSFFIGFITVVTLFPGRTHSSTQTPEYTMGVPMQTTSKLSLEPPSQSLVGTIATYSGSLLHKLRSSNDFTPATPSGILKIGESLATGDTGTATITIPPLVTITMSPMSEVVFANIFSENTVLQQKSGQITYRVAPKSQISIRILHSLITLKEAVATIHTSDSKTTVTVDQGIVQIGIVDPENITHVYEVTENKIGIIKDQQRTVSIYPSL